MDTKVRKLLFKPISKGILNAVVPDLCVELKNGKKVRAAALLTSQGSEFVFTLHFKVAVPPGGLGRLEKKVITLADQITVTGQISGEMAFLCRVFPPAGYTTRSRGTSTLKIQAHRIELVAEGSEKWNTRKMRRVLKMPSKPRGEGELDFHSHVIFHGPKLQMMDAGSKTTRTNDFLGDAVSSSFDTHIFSGIGYEGGLIQKDAELHLHLRSKAGEALISDPSELTDRISRSVGFAFGFHPWPAYREIKIDHRVVERWICPRLRLKQMHIAPVSKSLWSTFMLEKANPLHSIIPTIAAGLNALAKAEQDRIETLLWNVRSATLSNLPTSISLLIISSSLDGLMKVIAGVPDSSRKDKTDKVWRKASDEVGFRWGSWTEQVFALWGKYRHSLSHGRFWAFEEENSLDDLLDYAQLSCAFMIMIAARCGYTGPILANPFELHAIVISEKQGKK